MPVAPVMLQYWFRKECQVPAYLRTLKAKDDVYGFDVAARAGIPLVDKIYNEAIDTSSLHDELEANGLRLTHASRVDRLFATEDSPSERFYYVFRFHYFPRATAVVHEGVDTEKLVLCLEEINKMAFWGVRTDLNRGRVCPWISVSCKGRVQRYTGEDLDRPEMRKIVNAVGDKIGSAQLTADQQLHYLGDNRFQLSSPQ